MYDAVLGGDVVALGGELAAWLVRTGAACVVTDSAEGYNPTHDLCRAMSGIAVEAARRATGRGVPLYEYVVTGERRACLAGRCTGALRWRPRPPTHASSASASTSSRCWNACGP